MTDHNDQPQNDDAPDQDALATNDVTAEQVEAVAEAADAGDTNVHADEPPATIDEVVEETAGELPESGDTELTSTLSTEPTPGPDPDHEPEVEPAVEGTVDPHVEAEAEDGEEDTSDDTSDDTSEDTSAEEADAEDAEEGLEEGGEESEPDLDDAATAPATDVPPELAAAVEEAFVDVDATAVEGEEDEELLDDWQPGDWYVVHTYAGYENKVKADLETRVASMNMEEKIYEVVIPMEEVMEIKGGKKQMVQRKVFPGYLLVRMEVDPESWGVVRNTPGVTGFVGSGNKPIPLSEKEVDKILQRKGEAEKPKARLEWQVNDPVRVTTGPFANFQGVIHEVDDERQKVKVLVNIFGRETPVELSMNEIAKV